MTRRTSRATLLCAVAGGLAAASASAQSLSTIYATNNNGSVGGIVYFDIVTGASPITITSLGTNLGVQAAGTYGFTMYTKPGTYLGSESNAGAWTVATTGTVAGTGITNTPSPVTMGSVVLGAGTTTGVALVLAGGGQPSASHYYTNGTGSNQSYSNSDLTINLGAANNVPFAASPFTPRVWNGTINYTVGGTTGACCLGAPTYQCIQTTATNCASSGGTYAGDNVTCAAANCPPAPTGACCFFNGSCQVLSQANCTSQGGIYSGNNVTCAAANCLVQGWQETGEAGELPATAQVATGSGALNAIRGTLGTGDADMFQINVCGAANFTATTVGGSTVDTQLFLFKLNGTGVAFNDDDPIGTTLQSRLSSQFVAPLGDGLYYLAISQWDKDPLGVATSGEIWLDTPYAVERAPDGPAAAEAVGSWNATTGAGGQYTIALTGACFVAGGCYANCDGSTGNPLLTANDFQCFLNKYASGDTYANCDGSTGNPLLTANDFQCFLNKYAGGCT
jgi:hypothetical protein